MSDLFALDRILFENFCDPFIDRLRNYLRIRLQIKDLANALDTAHESGAPLPLTVSVMEMLQSLKADGLGEADHGALVRYYEKLAKAEVKR